LPISRMPDTYEVFPSHLLMTTRGATSKPRCS
jgi:hypothetical protein